MKLLGIFLVYCICCVYSAPQSEVESLADNDERNSVTEETATAKPYHYKYTVKDEEKQLFFEKSESGEDGSVKGKFSVLLADGRLLTVEYVADKENGFAPKLSFENNFNPFKLE